MLGTSLVDSTALNFLIRSFVSATMYPVGTERLLCLVIVRLVSLVFFFDL